MRRAHLLAFILVISTASLGFLSGCKGFIEKSAMDTTSSILTRARKGMQMENDVEIARAAIPASLKTVEGFHVANPANADLHGILAEGWCQYATGFLTEDWEVAKWKGQYKKAETLRKRGTNLYLRCLNYALKLLDDEWSATLYSEIAGVENLLKQADEDDVVGLFWTGLALGSIVNLNRDDIVLVSYLAKAKLILERVVELQPDFNNGLALMALGLMNSSQGKALGGKPEVGKKYFEDADAVTGGKFLLVKVLMARNYAVITQNRQLFHKTLVDVLQTDPAIFPEQRLANELAHVKARRYLQRESDWF